MPRDNQDPVTAVMEAFSEFKDSNNRLLAAKADGKAVGDLTAKVERISDALDRFEPMNRQLTTATAQQNAMQEQLDRVETILNRPGAMSTGGRQEGGKVRAAFDRAMRQPAADRDPADVELCKKHMASLIKGDDTGAGYLLAPPDLQREIVKNVIEMSPIRAIASVRNIGGPSFKRPKRTGTGSAARVGEQGQRGNTGDPQ